MPWTLREIDVVGIILNFPVKLVAYPDIGVTMDIVVIDVPDILGMLLSRMWAVVATLGGSIQMDWTYSMIPASEDAHVKLYREKERKYHVEDPDDPDNEYICEMDSLGNHVIYANYLIPIREKSKKEEVDELWRMSFDGVFSKSGKGAGISKSLTLLIYLNLMHLIMWLSMKHFC